MKKIYIRKNREMEFRIADTFTDSLTEDEQKAVKTTSIFS